MAGRKSSDKGWRGEVDAARVLTPVFYPDDDGKILKTPGSGTWTGLTIMTGDLVLVHNDELDSRFPFYWQVKFCAPSYFPTMWWLLGNVTVLEKWMAEVQEKLTNKVSLVPFVLWRTERVPWFVTMTLSDYRVQQEWFGPLPTFWERVVTRKDVESRTRFGQGILTNIISDGNRENEDKGLVTMAFGLWSKWFKREMFVGKANAKD